MSDYYADRPIVQAAETAEHVEIVFPVEGEIRTLHVETVQELFQDLHRAGVGQLNE